MIIEVIKADYMDVKHAQAIETLLDAYARDPMGGGKALDEKVRTNIVRALAKLPYAFSLLAYADNKPVGLANCFEAFSTFSCRPLVNIHDFAVLEAYRGQGISQLMLETIEEIARLKGCCKITLEVLSQNHVARAAYEKYGFSAYELAPQAGTALFWQKNLS